jgi:hypothetical protein
MADDEALVVVEVVGEGVVDIGPITRDPQAETPDRGVVPILLHRLCGEPETLRVKRRRIAFLQGKNLAAKVRFARRQAPYNGSSGLVIVLDTEGDHPARIEQLHQACRSVSGTFPTAVGVAHPCIEAWLMADAAAIAQVCGLTSRPELPEVSETLAAPCRRDGHDPKLVLARCAGQATPLAASSAWAIARFTRDLLAVRTRCPLSFAPFADAVEGKIRPLFGDSPGSSGCPAS